MRCKVKISRWSPIKRKESVSFKVKLKKLKKNPKKRLIEKEHTKSEPSLTPGNATSYVRIQIYMLPERKYPEQISKVNQNIDEDLFKILIGNIPWNLPFRLGSSLSGRIFGFVTTLDFFLFSVTACSNVKLATWKNI